MSHVNEHPVTQTPGEDFNTVFEDFVKSTVEAVSSNCQKFTAGFRYTHYGG